MIESGNMVKTRRRKSLARKYRDLFAECPIEKDKIIRLIGEMMVADASYAQAFRRLRTMDIGFWDVSKLTLRFSEDKTLRGQFLDEQDFIKGWEYEH